MSVFLGRASPALQKRIDTPTFGTLPCIFTHTPTNYDMMTNGQQPREERIEARRSFCWNEKEMRVGFVEPNVSVIIPVYNDENYLRECLDSVVNQTLKDIKIVCVNDGSTDGSPAILEEYAFRDDGIVVINKTMDERTSTISESVLKQRKQKNGQYNMEWVVYQSKIQRIILPSAFRAVLSV